MGQDFWDARRWQREFESKEARVSFFFFFSPQISLRKVNLFTRLYILIFDILAQFSVRLRCGGYVFKGTSVLRFKQFALLASEEFLGDSSRTY